MRITTKLWIGILLLVCLSPLGLILPEYFKAGSLWQAGQEFSRLLNVPLPDYAFKDSQEKGVLGLSFGYVISGIVGIATIVIIALLIGKKFIKKR